MKTFDTYLEAVKSEEFNNELNRTFEVMKKHGYPVGGGSYLFDGRNLVWNSLTYPKQELLFNTVKSLKADIPTIVEIGVYAGHSKMIMDMAREPIQYLGIDPMRFAFQEALLKEEDIFNGTSKYVLNPYFVIKPDLIHIDGSHDYEDFIFDLKWAKDYPQAIVVVDDWDGVYPQLPEDLKESIEIIEVADCPNPNAVIKFK